MRSRCAGSGGAWRREAVERAGGFASNTLAEDQDLTLRVRMLGYRIVYADKAIAYTEAPDTIQGLAKQRFRWSYGTLQCMWKHRSALFNKKYGALGFVAMPNVWIFQIFFLIASPLMDTMFVFTLIAYCLQRLQHPHEFMASHFTEIAFYYSFFLIVDILLALWVSLSSDARTGSCSFAPIQRSDIQIMYWVMVSR